MEEHVADEGVFFRDGQAIICLSGDRRANEAFWQKFTRDKRETGPGGFIYRVNKAGLEKKIYSNIGDDQKKGDILKFNMNDRVLVF